MSYFIIKLVNLKILFPQAIQKEFGPLNINVRSIPFKYQVPFLQSFEYVGGTGGIYQELSFLF
ncbi:hypothetical protein [Candidatus Hakubella thermalkaliphila]|uniref:hypothetical protein n=1 Tax=Candidatus Hakubella thermalkaliphila TaxID=2754717 RepID=UPI002158CFC5|nr:hypothetical protein [Candidatus Hakubella thermalkaliphila]